MANLAGEAANIPGKAHVVLVEEMRIHSGMSLFSGRQPLDTDAL